MTEDRRLLIFTSEAPCLSTIKGGKIMIKDTIVESIEFLAKIKEEGGIITKTDEAFLLDAEEVLGIALNQISFIKERIQMEEINV